MPWKTTNHPPPPHSGGFNICGFASLIWNNHCLPAFESPKNKDDLRKCHLQPPQTFKTKTHRVKYHRPRTSQSKAFSPLLLFCNAGAVGNTPCKINNGTHKWRFGSDDFPFQLGDVSGFKLIFPGARQKFTWDLASQVTCEFVLFFSGLPAAQGRSTMICEAITKEICAKTKGQHIKG